MDFLTPLFSIIDSSSAFMARRVGHILHCEQRIRRMLVRLEELKATKADLKREIYQAELSGFRVTNQTKTWVQQVEVIESEVTLILAQPMQLEGRCFCRSSCSARYKSGKKALNKEREISDLIDHKKSLDVLVKGLPPNDLVPSTPTVGLGGALQMVCQSIADNEVGIIGIYGMGGAGKTTLLKEINNEYLVRTHDFEAVIWVTVSKDSGVDRLQQALMSRLGLPWEETAEQEQLASRIYNFMRRIKFLLLLDDIWKRIDFAKIGIPVPDKTNGSKVVFTTRSMDVCGYMDAHMKLKLRFLNEKGSWKLFCDKAGEANVMNTSIEPYAREIVRMCGGLPLALITVGRAMANRTSEEEWKYALEVLNYAPSEFQGMEDIFAPLKFSYDNLPDSTLKMCFLYCALFPNDYPLEKEQLIDYWIGEGFLDGSNEGSIHNKGHVIIGSLKVACLLESGEDETQVKMHDVVRSFALWVASGCSTDTNGKFLVQGCNGLTESPGVEKWEEAERISLLNNEITTLSKVPSCPKLSTLLLNCNYGLSRIANDFFHFMPLLKVLDLSTTNIREIPESIGQLAELRYLDLSRTKITSLPKELGCLSKLRHLDLQRTHFLTRIPREAILGLSNLRVFNLYYSFEGWENPDCEVVFEDLQNMSYLIGLGFTVTKNSSLKKLSCFYHLIDCIQFLYIKGCEGLIYLMVPSVYGGGEKLRRLSIYNCDTLKEIDLGSDEGNDWLPRLEVLALHTLSNLTTIWRISVTPKCHRNLRYINIWHCPKLKNISWILQLPSLEKIYVFYCNGMEEIIGDEDIVTEGSSEVCLPKLKTISFRSLPELRSITSVVLALPVLRTIALIDCPQLKKLPSEGYDSSNPPIVYCTRDWWDGLEWGDSTGSSVLHPQFIAI